MYFERILSNMADPAIASNSFDYVFCCEVLHHNDAVAMRRTFREVHRILKPGGKLLVINEPMRFPLNRKPDHAVDVAAFEGNEHVYYFHEYYLAARRVGFSARVLPPLYMPFFSREPSVLPLDIPNRDIPHWAVRYWARRSKLGQRTWLWCKMLTTGDFSLNMICTKRNR